ncbi:hypothetical protein FKG94_20430 [Exilibacterium tricleocarpae]|uniref:Rap1a immunity protein domain-containing protein n=1 Tax=Exilibacterium tricleocarpae TaxID=2591008 RepID=A0A545T0I1_9GAMM|nr:hypothetical protein [Exilibacterium tricleocarpae]TQV70701.1 hypothetical protein FKG94_20430 [Exilibacterium tricleocarpae]
MKTPMTHVARCVGITLILAGAGPAGAFTTQEFLALCGDAKETCASRPAVQFYLGGALDALAVVNDAAKEQDQPIYCVPEQALFDMGKIVAHVVSVSRRFENKNAMTGVIDYLRTYGGCRPAQRPQG